MIQGKAVGKRARIRMRMVRIRCAPPLTVRVRPSADPLVLGGGLPGTSGARDNLSCAARALETALATLDPLLIRRVGMQDEDVADVQEAVGLIVEGLAILARAERRLGATGAGYRNRRPTGARFLVA